MHTNYSDGEYNPNELIKLAKENNIKIMSITDHDSISAYKKIKKIDGIDLIYGIELTSYYNNQAIHILGYDINIDNENLLNHINKYKTNKYYIIIKCLSILYDKYNIEISSDDITKLFNKKGTIGRSEIAKLLVKNKYVNSTIEAYDKYLANIYQYINIDKIKISPKEIIKIIHNANGVAILAHPKQIKIEEKEEFIKKLVKEGLDGIEVYHSIHSNEDINKYLKIAKENNLIITGGSDFHGPNTKEKIPISHAKLNNYTTSIINLLDYIKNE